MISRRNLVMLKTLFAKNEQIIQLAEYIREVGFFLLKRYYLSSYHFLYKLLPAPRHHSVASPPNSKKNHQIIKPSRVCYHDYFRLDRVTSGVILVNKMIQIYPCDFKEYIFLYYLQQCAKCAEIFFPLYTAKRGASAGGLWATRHDGRSNAGSSP